MEYLIEEFMERVDLDPLLQPDETREPDWADVRGIVTKSRKTRKRVQTAEESITKIWGPHWRDVFTEPTAPAYTYHTLSDDVEFLCDFLSAGEAILRDRDYHPRRSLKPSKRRIGG